MPEITPFTSSSKMDKKEEEKVRPS